MPDVVRSDSQRSDASLRPRVSFNRDVHVKRIVPRERKGSLNTEENVYSGRKAHSRRLRKDTAEEADPHRGFTSDKFYSLPRTRRENEELNEVFTSLDRGLMTNNKGLDSKPPKKPQRIFTSQYKTQGSRTPTGSLKKSLPRTHLHRSVSDASNSKEKLSGSLGNKNRTSSKQNLNSLRSHKKQLSPIVEQTPREDYFSSVVVDNYKENNGNNINVNNRKSDQLKEHKQEKDGSKNKKRSAKKDEKKIIVIDIDKAEDISKSKKSKLKNSLFGKKLKSITTKRNRKKSKSEPVAENVEKETQIYEPPHPPTRLEEAIESLKNQVNTSPKMIHSSQKPAEKPPLTRGRTVDLMVRRLNKDTSLPPPKPNVLVTPNQSVQHNNNQPFSYTRGLSPEKLEDNVKSNGVPVIYAQVVCNSDQNGSAKQTIHKSYPKRYSQSDSDEGLGNEEGLMRTKDKSPKHFTHFGDDVHMRLENPITPKYKVLNHSSYDMQFSSHDSDNFYFESCQRGCADGMESKKRESSLEKVRNGVETDESDSNRNNLSVRRDLLESRINRKINDSRGTENSKFERSASSSPSPVSNMRQTRKYSSDLDSSKHYYSIDEPKSFDSNISDYNDSFTGNKEIDYRKYEAKQRTIFSKNLCKSTPDIYHRSSERPNHHQHSYHDSLQRDKYRTNRIKNEKDKFGDSGIENDIKRESIVNLSSQKSHLHYANNYAESEDEGFASSLVIANDKQHAKKHVSRKLSRKDYDSDMTFSGEDDAYRNVDSTDYKVVKDEYVPRERSIDDGSHYDPIIDKELTGKENLTLKRNTKKSQKSEKKSSLEKMKQLFTRDNKKKKEKDMVREESLLARYTEYKGSTDYSDYKKDVDSDEVSKNIHHASRKRLPTPSPNSSPVQELDNSKKTSNVRTSWFKSLDRISRNTLKKKENKNDHAGEGEEDRNVFKRSSPKNLRFFGDTDSDSGDSPGKRLTPKSSQTTLKDRVTSQSSRDLHNISEDTTNSEMKKRTLHKSLLNISDSNRDHKNGRLNSKPPISPNPRIIREVPKPSTNRRRKYEHSSVEGSTEGDSSQQSQKSVVYLHAATVGDIPGTATLRYGQKSASKEELAISDSSRIQPHTKKISRSFSVLAPWRPRHPHEGRQIDYSQYQSNGKMNRKDNTSTMKSKNQNSREMKNSLTMGRSFKSKENVSKPLKEEAATKSSSTLYKKKERVPREYLRYGKEKEEKKAAKYRSTESLRHNGTMTKKSGESSRDISRSVSMPKDSERVAGWYKNSRKDHHKSDYITQRV